ncbi:MAG: DNA polymerase III subunit beta [Eubacteriales bacterium]
MKFSCDKELILSAVSVAARNVSPKSSIAALMGILVEVTDVVKVTGYNMETGVALEMEADIEEEGTLVLTARLFADILRKLPDDVVYFSSKDFMVTISCGKAKFDILAIDPEEFPALPVVDDNQGILLEQKALKSLIGDTLFSVSMSESRPIHTGALCEVEDGVLTMVAVDGYRLALRREPVSDVMGAAPFSFVVPAAALSEMEKICMAGDVMVRFNHTHVLFQTEQATLISRRIEGEFLNYRDTLPKNNKIQVIGDVRDLSSCVERVSLMISEKLKVPLRCYLEGNNMEFSCKTAIGEAKDTCSMEGPGGELEIGFNNRYLLEAIRHAPADKVRMEFSTPVAPCLIMPENPDEDHFCYMVLPVRLKAN